MLKLMLKGNVIRQVEATESVAGKNVYLSIDMELQKYMTDAFSGKSGAFLLQWKLKLENN